MWYYLWVNDSTGTRIQKWYTASEAGCASGTGTCSVSPTTTLAPGAAQWWIQATNGTVYGPWSATMDFSVPVPNAPGAATLISPTGTITTTTPTYTWNAIPEAMWYYLWVNDSTGNRIQKWYTASEAGCASGTGTCSVSPTTTLASGAAQWWIQATNGTVYGPWSATMNFTVSP